MFTPVILYQGGGGTSAPSFTTVITPLREGPANKNTIQHLDSIYLIYWISNFERNTKHVVITNYYEGTVPNNIALKYCVSIIIRLVVP